MGSSVHRLYISNSNCERVVEQVKLDFLWVSWHQPGRNTSLNAADKWSLYQPLLHNHFSTTFIPYNSRPFVIECSKIFAWHPILLLQVYHASVELVGHIANQWAQALTYVAVLYIRKWEGCVWCEYWTMVAFVLFFFFLGIIAECGCWCGDNTTPISMFVFILFSLFILISQPLLFIGKYAFLNLSVRHICPTWTLMFLLL